MRAGKGFETVERYTDIEGLCRDESLEAETFRQKAKDAVVLLECMSNLAANEMFSGSDSNADCTGEFERMDTSRVKDRIMRGIDALTEVSDLWSLSASTSLKRACSSMMHGPGLICSVWEN